MKAYLQVVDAVTLSGQEVTQSLPGRRVNTATAAAAAAFARPRHLLCLLLWLLLLLFVFLLGCLAAFC
jgi:hypothetical protein